MTKQMVEYFANVGLLQADSYLRIEKYLPAFAGTTCDLGITRGNSALVITAFDKY